MGVFKDMENVEFLEFLAQSYIEFMIIGAVAGFLIYLFFSAIAEGISKVVNLIDIK